MNDKNLRLYILLGILGVLIVVAGVVYYPSVKNLINKDNSANNSTTNNTTTQNTQTQPKVEVNNNYNKNQVLPAGYEMPNVQNGTTPPPLPN